jgi:hypothetical protein
VLRWIVDRVIEILRKRRYILEYGVSYGLGDDNDIQPEDLGEALNIAEREAGLWPGGISIYHGKNSATVN